MSNINDLDNSLRNTNIKTSFIATQFGTEFLKTELQRRLVGIDQAKKAYALTMREQRKSVAKLGKALTQSILAEVMQTPVTTTPTTDEGEAVESGNFDRNDIETVFDPNGVDSNGGYVNQG